ncbi:MAG: hypothetical protein U0350_10955 [Caldilineaceae bacterium]
MQQNYYNPTPTTCEQGTSKRKPHRGGRTKQYALPLKNGGTAIVDGKYEYSFARWLDECGLQFTAHPPLALIYTGADGKRHRYEPDFVVQSFGGFYIDVKSRWSLSYSADKMALIQAQHPTVVVVAEDYFEYLGVPLVEPDESHIVLPSLGAQKQNKQRRPSGKRPGYWIGIGEHRQSAAEYRNTHCEQNKEQ